jgi:hypothetical protein
MAVQIGEVSINLRMSLAQFKTDTAAGTQAASQATKEMASSMSESTSEARGSLMLLNHELGIQMPRHLTALIAQIPGLSSAFATMLPLVGVIAAVEVVYKLIEAHKKLQDALDQGWVKSNEAITTHNDEISLSIEKYKELISKLEGHPANGLALALAEARVEADKLSASLTKDLEETIKLLESTAHGSIMTAILGTSGSGQAADVAKGLKDAIAAIPKDSNLSENTEKALVSAWQRAQSEIDKNNEKALKQAADAAAMSQTGGEFATLPVADYTAANTELQKFQEHLSVISDQMKLLGQQDTLKKQAADLEVVNKATKDLQKAAEEKAKFDTENYNILHKYVEEEAAQDKKLGEEKIKIQEQVAAILQKYNTEEETNQRHLDDEIYKHSAEMYKLDESAALEHATFLEKIGAISAAQRVELDREAEEKLYQNRLQALNREIALMEDDPADPLHALKRANAVEIIEQTHQDNMTRIDHAAIEQRMAAWNAGFASMNSGMTTLIGNMISGNSSITADLKTMLQNMLTSWIDYFVQLEMKALEASAIMKLTGLFGGAIAVPGMSAMPAGGAMPGGVPGLAEGGRMSAGDTAMVGENGPELWQPDTTGSIVPARPASESAAKGDTTHNTFNFHGVTDFDSFKENQSQLAARMYAAMATAARRKG